MKITLENIMDCLQDGSKDVSSDIVMTNLGLWHNLSDHISGQFINLTKKHVLLQGIQYINDNCETIEEMDCVIFDIVLREYVWTMGYTYLDEVVYHRRPLSYTVKALWQFITTEQHFLDAWAEESNKPYCKVPIILSTYVYTILTNLYMVEKKITKEEYEKLLEKYTKRTHVEYEKLVAPQLHPCTGLKILEIFERPKELEDYYVQKYDNFSLLKFNIKSDAIRQFYKTRECMPIGDNSAYLIN